MNQLERWILDAEDRSLAAAGTYLDGLFGNTFLPSHDLSHHLRVWNYGKYLLRESQKEGALIEAPLVAQLLEACLFHDAGMAMDQGTRHGELGTVLYGEFARNPSAEVSEAIRKHDNKEGLQYRIVKAGTAPGLLGLLSMADDMDALGIMGIYRYAEIYLMRDTGLELLGNQVLKNASHRYRNLMHSTLHLPEVRSRVQKEFECLQEFYHLYVQQTSLAPPLELPWEGPAGVLRLIDLNVKEERKNPWEISDHLKPAQHALSLRSYFKRLQDAWHQDTHVV